MAFMHRKVLNLFESKVTGLKFVFSLFLIYFSFSFFLPPLVSQAGASDTPDPKVGQHLYKHYCAVCHGVTGAGDGLNADHLGDVHPTDLTSEDIDKLDDDEIYEVIYGGGIAIDISYYMPPWGAVFSESEIHSLVAYIRTLSEGQGSPAKEIRIGDLGARGKGRCPICHAKERNLLRPIAPNIGHEGSKWKPEALSAFLREPRKLRPNGFMPFTKAKMPNFFFTDQEVAALTDYLMTLKDEGLKADVLMGWDPSDPAVIEEGEFLFVEEYACDGCHKRSPGGEGGIVGPELSHTVERIRPEWLYYWLKNPQAMRPDTPMPNFKMSDSQIKAVLAYILSLNDGGSQAMTVSDFVSDSVSISKGKRILETKNCIGCHLIDSFNTQLGLKGEIPAEDDFETLEEE